MSSNNKSITKFSISFFIIFIGVFQLGLPLYADFLLSLILSLIIKDFAIIFSTSVLLVFSFYILGFFVKNDTVHYRPNDKLMTHFNFYEPNEKVKMKMPYGDLGAMTAGNDLYKSIHEPRFVEFITDRNGYRNKDEIVDADFALIGDSFVVGNGTSQDSILSENLSRSLDYKFVNLGYPGSPYDYEIIAKQKLKLYGKKVKIFLFYFEGNDFTNSHSAEPPKKFIFRKYIKELESFKSKYLNLIYPKDHTLVRAIRRKGMSSYSKIQNFIKSKISSQNLEYKDQINKVKIIKIGSKNIGFLQSYTDATNSKVLNAYKIKDNEVLKNIEAIFFIPTKFRVYNDIEKNLGFETLNNLYLDNCIPIINTTNELKKKASELVLNDEYVFWRDDTHLNKFGIDVISKLIKYYIDNFYNKYSKEDCSLRDLILKEKKFN